MVPEVHVDAEAWIQKLQLVEILDLAAPVRWQTREVQVAIDVLRHPSLRSLGVTFRHIDEVLAPTPAIMLIVDVDFQVPANEAAAKALIVLVLDVEHALLSLEVLRQVLGCAAAPSIEKRLEGCQVVLGHVGELKAFDAEDPDSAGSSKQLFTVYRHLLQDQMEEISPGAQTMH